MRDRPGDLVGILSWSGRALQIYSFTDTKMAHQKYLLVDSTCVRQFRMMHGSTWYFSAKTYDISFPMQNIIELSEARQSAIAKSKNCKILKVEAPMQWLDMRLNRWQLQVLF